jgi:hypothetical protein
MANMANMDRTIADEQMIEMHENRSGGGVQRIARSRKSFETPCLCFAAEFGTPQSWIQIILLIPRLLLRL